MLLNGQKAADVLLATSRKGWNDPRTGRCIALWDIRRAISPSRRSASPTPFHITACKRRAKASGRCRRRGYPPSGHQPANLWNANDFRRMAMGTDRMKYALSVQGQWMGDVLVIGGCHKNMTGGMIGIPARRGAGDLCLGGTNHAGTMEGPVSVDRVGLRGCRRVNSRAISQQDLEGIEQNACPRPAPAAGCTRRTL